MNGVAALQISANSMSSSISFIFYEYSVNISYIQRKWLSAILLAKLQRYEGDIFILVGCFFFFSFKFRSSPISKCFVLLSFIGVFPEYS